MADFDERSGLVTCKTPWGYWGQTMEEVQIEVHLDKETRAKAIRCSIKPKHLSLSVSGSEIFQVSLICLSYF